MLDFVSVSHHLASNLELEPIGVRMMKSTEPIGIAHPDAEAHRERHPVRRLSGLLTPGYRA